LISAGASRDVARANIRSGNVETIALDPVQDGIGPLINTGHGVAGMQRALANKHPWPEILREIRPGPLRGEAGYSGVRHGSEGEYMHGDLNEQWNAPRSTEGGYRLNLMDRL
jgi:hypothetical protein